MNFDREQMRRFGLVGRFNELHFCVAILQVPARIQIAVDFDIKRTECNFEVIVSMQRQCLSLRRNR